MKTCQNNFSRARKRHTGLILINMPQKLKKGHCCIVNSSKLWPVLLLNSRMEAFISASQFGTSFFQAVWPHLPIPVQFSFDWSQLRNCTLKLINLKVSIRLNSCCLRQYRQILNSPIVTPIFLCIWCNSQLKAQQEISFPSCIPLHFFSFFHFSHRLFLLLQCKMTKMEVRKAKLIAMLLYHHFITGIELKCSRQHITRPVMSTLSYHEMVGKVNSVLPNVKYFKCKQPTKTDKLNVRTSLS